MRKTAVIAIALLLFASFAYAQFTVSQIVNKHSSSVVTIVALDENDQPLSLGSGFFINAEGDLVTNHHVLEGCSKAIIKTLKGGKGEILEIINDDPELDILIARSSLKNTYPVPLGDSDTITMGEEIIAIGNPVGLEGTVSNGIVSGIRKLDGFKLIQITAPISPGSSGGPVFNTMGKVIGIATAYLDVGQNLNFALPINYLRSLKQSRIKLSSLPKSIPRKENLEKDKTLVEAFDVHYNYSHDIGWLDSIDFSIKNLSDYPIKNIKLLLVYKNFRGEMISYSAVKIKDTILPKLALQFRHEHYVRHWGKPGERWGDFLPGSVEIRILDYQIDKASPVESLFK